MLEIYRHQYVYIYLEFWMLYADIFILMTFSGLFIVFNTLKHITVVIYEICGIDGNTTVMCIGCV